MHHHTSVDKVRLSTDMPDSVRRGSFAFKEERSPRRVHPACRVDGRGVEN